VSRIAGDANAFALAGLLYVGAAVTALPATVARPPTTSSLRVASGRPTIAVVAGGATAPRLLAARPARAPAAAASLLLNRELVSTVLLAAAVFHEHIGPRVASGTAVVMAGGVVLTWSVGPGLRLGALLVIAACMCWALDNCITAGVDQLAPHHIT